MKHENQNINQHINSALKTFSDGHSGQRQPTFSDDELVRTAYLFAALKIIYPRDYMFDVESTPENARMQKRAHTKDIGRYSIEEIDKGLEFVREQKRQGNNKYLRLDIDLVVGAIRQANRLPEAHQAYKPLPPPSLTKDQRRAEMAKIKQEIGL